MDHEDGRDGHVRILAVQSSLADNGGLRVLLDLVERWHAIGVAPQLFVVKQYDGGPTPVVPESVSVSVGSAAAGRTRYQAPRALARLIRLGRRADVLVSGSEIGESLLLGYLAARVTSRPFVVMVHADLDDAIETWTAPRLRAVTRWANAHADAVVCVESGLVAGVVANGASPAVVRVVNNGIDVARVRRRAGLSPEGSETAVVPKGHVPLVVANGRLAKQKGFDLLIEAHAKVCADGLPHRLTITGEGPERSALEALIRRLDVAASVSLPGFAENPYITMAAADVFVLSSRSEGLPLTLLEALACGVPVIATECGTGPRNLLGDQEYGALVEAGSVSALADALTAHLTAPDAFRERAQRGPDRARRFDVRRTAEEHLDVLRAVVSGTLVDRAPAEESSGVRRA